MAILFNQVFIHRVVADETKDGSLEINSQDWINIQCGTSTTIIWQFQVDTNERAIYWEIIGDNVLEICDVSRFSEGDVIEIIDDSYQPGFRTSVASINVPLNQLILKNIIPTIIPGQTGFDGFKTASEKTIQELVIQNHLE